VRELNKLQTFVRVVEHRSFSKAARELHVSSSVISKHIKDLEHALGFSVLQRSTRGVAPTEAGERVFRECATLFAEIDRVITTARNIEVGPVGTLRVECDPAYAQDVVAPILPKFTAEYPNLRIELAAARSGGSLGKGYDVIISGSTPSEPGMIGRAIAALPHVVCASPAYFRRHGVPKTPEDLRNRNCLVDVSSAQKEWSFAVGSKKLMIDVKGDFFSNDAKVLAAMAVQGLGIARIPFYVARPYIAARALQSIFEKCTLARETMYAHHLRSDRLPAKTEAFVAFLQKQLTIETKTKIRNTRLASAAYD
jgi:DNA-binding transcriptional LysR family regulator